MCQIDQAIQHLVNRLQNKGIISEQLDLTYSWYDRINRVTYTENTVNDLFSRYNGRIINTIFNRVSLQEVILEILDWGIPNVGRETRIGLARRYSHLLNEIHQESNEDNRVEYVIGRLGEETPLSSWTKVLAAYAPNRFWIYDARVALALRFLSKYANFHFDGWFMPTPGSQYVGELASTINNGHLNTRNANPSNSYRNYLELLLMEGQNCDCAADAARTASHFEKKLFMLGGAIRDMYEHGNQDVKNIIIAIGCEN